MNYYFKYKYIIYSLKIIFIVIIFIFNIKEIYKYFYKNEENNSSDYHNHFINEKSPHSIEITKKNISSIFTRFFGLLSNIVNKKNKINDICIIGLWYGSNYGSMLTYYALHEVVKEMNYSILMIDDPLEPDDIVYTKTHPKTLISSFYNISQKEKLDYLFKFNRVCKCFLVGSDQLWNIHLSRGLNQFYFLGFVDNETKKISYGTSFGSEYKGTKEEKKITKLNLDRFDSISVRDELSLNILKETFCLKNVVQVCDPTLLLDSAHYMKLINNSKIQYLEEYILAYILDPNQKIGNILEQVSIDRNLKVMIILDHLPSEIENNKIKLSLSGKGKVEIKDIFHIEDWLWYFYYSKSIITDSFHGTIFSIIFRKPFVTLRNVIRGGERFTSLLKPLGLIKRLFETAESINKRYDLFDNIDYKFAEQNLKKIREKSHNWLRNKLQIIFK